jgi:hypothetical protein
MNAELDRQRARIREYGAWICNQFHEALQESLHRDCRTGSAEQQAAAAHEYYNAVFRPQRDQLTTRLNACIVHWGSSFDDHCVKIQDEINDLVADQKYTRRYEFLMHQLGQTQDLFRRGTHEEIQDYMTIKRCENSDYYGAVPAAPGSGT